ncbi:unnamed protein product [Caenorhabditis angaria]|uniref:Uncharacterized protein n=1 Tax=Caenorhabditis angaria TaxID=860376 RepID=A0A9P1J1H0_9PELO|nr:unnamed protein product [Caenorhabditis angaria]
MDRRILSTSIEAKEIREKMKTKMVTFDISLSSKDNILLVFDGDKNLVTASTLTLKESSQKKTDRNSSTSTSTSSSSPSPNSSQKERSPRKRPHAQEIKSEKKEQEPLSESHDELSLVFDMERKIRAIYNLKTTFEKQKPMPNAKMCRKAVETVKKLWNEYINLKKKLDEFQKFQPEEDTINKIVKPELKETSNEELGNRFRTIIGHMFFDSTPFIQSLFDDKYNYFAFRKQMISFIDNFKKEKRLRKSEKIDDILKGCIAKRYGTVSRLRRLIVGKNEVKQEIKFLEKELNLWKDNLIEALEPFEEESTS